MRTWGAAELAERIAEGTKGWFIPHTDTAEQFPIRPPQQENPMTDIPPVPSAPTAPTLLSVLEEKLKQAKQRAADAAVEVKTIESEIASLPKSLHGLTYSDMIARVETWYK
jgi:hypothetical protein